MEVDFNPVTAIYYGSDTIAGVLYKGEQIWPITGKIAGVPSPQEIQLPDDPFAGTMQTINVHLGQTIIFKYPVNPKAAWRNNDPGWRHLAFCYMDATQTYNAAFARSTGSEQLDVLGQTAGYAMNIGIFGRKAETFGLAFNVGQFASSKNDFIVTVRGDATEDYLYVVPYNGNFGYTNYDENSILYKLVIVENAPPPKPALTRVSDDLMKLMENYVDGMANIWGTLPSQPTIPEIDLPLNGDLYLPFATQIGQAWDVGATAILDTSNKVAGTIKNDGSNNTDGSMQTRYGGVWTPPPTAHVGDVFYVAWGPDIHGLAYYALKITMV